MWRRKTFWRNCWIFSIGCDWKNLKVFFLSCFDWWYFNLYQFPMGSLCWLALLISHAVIKLHVWLLLISVWCLNGWSQPTNITLVNVSVITTVTYLQGLLYLVHVWCVTRWLLSTNVSHTPIRWAYESVWSKTVYCCIRSFILHKKVFMLVL